MIFAFLILALFCIAILLLVAKRQRRIAAGSDPVDQIAPPAAKQGNAALLSESQEKAAQTPQAAPEPAQIDAKEWRTINVFVSSTFVDFHEERDLLRKIVFPELQERAKALHCHLVPVDLRWGVDTASVDEDERETHVLQVCLDEVMRSRPFFITLLGERYGWVPSPEIVETVTGGALGEQALNKSVTALEIEFGMLRDPAQSHRSRFYFRNEPETGTAGDDGAAAQLLPEAAELSRLKAQIKTAFPERVHTYQNSGQTAELEDFARRVTEDVWADLVDELGQQAAPQEMEVASNADQQAAFIEEAGRGFQGRAGLVAEMISFATAPLDEQASHAAVICGAPGSGKSALYAHLTQHPAIRADGGLVVTHAAGIGAQTSTSRAALLHLTEQLAAAATAARPDPDAAEADLAALLHQLLRDIAAPADTTKGRRVIIMLDGYEHLDAAAGQMIRTVLIDTRVPNVRVILTSADAAAARFDASAIIRAELPALTPDEIGDIIQARTTRERRAINPDVVTALLTKTDDAAALAAGNALWLSLALNRLMEFDGADHARVKAMQDEGIAPDEAINNVMSALVAEMPSDVVGLYQFFLYRMENFPGIDFQWVRLFAMFIAISREGWRERDLLQLMAIGRVGISGEQPAEMEELQPHAFSLALEGLDDITPVPSIRFAILRRAFGAHISAHTSDGAYFFRHAALNEAIVRRYFNFTTGNPNAGVPERELGLSALGQLLNQRLDHDLKAKGLVPGMAVSNLHAIAFAYLRSLPASDPLRQTESMHHCVQARYRNADELMSPFTGRYYASLAQDQNSATEAQAANHYIASHMANCAENDAHIEIGERVVSIIIASAERCSPDYLSMFANGLSNAGPAFAPLTEYPPISVLRQLQSHLLPELQRTLPRPYREEYLEIFDHMLATEQEDIQQHAAQAGDHVAVAEMMLGEAAELFRRGEYGEATALYQQVTAKFVDDEGQPSSDAGAGGHRLAAIAYGRIGHIATMLEEWQDAAPNCETSAALFKLALQAAPDDTLAEQDFAVSLVAFANVLPHVGQQDRAGSLMLRALEILHRFGPDDVEASRLRDVVESLIEIGNFLNAFNHSENAKRAWQCAVTLARPSFANNEYERGVKLAGTTAAKALGEHEASRGHFETGKEFLSDALSIWRGVAVDEPASMAAATAQSECLSALGMVAKHQDAPDQALQHFRERLQVLEQAIAHQNASDNLHRQFNVLTLEKQAAMTHLRISELIYAASRDEGSLTHLEAYHNFFKRRADFLSGDIGTEIETATAGTTFSRLLLEFGKISDAKQQQAETEARFLAVLEGNTINDDEMQAKVEEAKSNLSVLGMQMKYMS